MKTGMAVYEGVNELESSAFPSLHHRKEGWLRHQENVAKPPKLTQPGWFSFIDRPYKDMNELFLAGVAGALVAAATASLVFPLVNRVAMAVRAIDYAGGRRLQREAIPRIGGIAIPAGIGAG